jgi:hypothetical protein
VIPWRLYVAGALVAALLTGLGYVGWLQQRTKALKAQAATATQQAENNAEAVRQADHYVHTTEIIRERTEDAVQSVQAAPGASAPLPDDVRRAWADGIDGMRRPADVGAADGSGDVPH